MGARADRILSRLAGSVRDYAAVTRSPAYFPLWLAQLVSSFGDTLHYIALVVLVFALSGRGLAVAGVVAAEIVPILVLAPVAGVVVDRASRKTVLVGADVFRAALVLTLVHPLGVWHAYAVAAGLAAASAFANPALNAVIPALTTPEQRLAANSVSWSTAQLVQVVASAVAGGLIVAIGTSAAFALNAASFVASALLIASLRVPPHVGQGGAMSLRGYARDVRDGIAYARRSAFLSRLVAVQTLASLAVGATGAMLVVLSERHLGLPPAGFAWLIGAIGAGALLGPLIPNTFARDVGDPRWLFVPYVIRGIGDVLIAVVTPLPLALVILFVYGLNTSTGMVVYSTTLQGAVPDHLRGRAFALLDVDWNLMQLVSLAAGGVLADRFGIEPVYWVGGGLLIVAGSFGLGSFGAFRRSRQDASDSAGT